MKIYNGYIFLWLGTNASIPAGWERVTSLDDYFIRIAGDSDGYGNVGDTGGSASHQHTSPSHTHNIGNHVHSITLPAGSGGGDVGGGGSQPGVSLTHNHGTFDSGNPTSNSTENIAVTYNNYSSYPPYRRVIFITPVTEVDGLPLSVVTLVEGSKIGALDIYSGLSNRYLRGAATGGNAGSTGGSATNNHTITHDHDNTHAHSAVNSNNANSNVSINSTGSAARDGHNHSVSLNTSSTLDSDDNSSIGSQSESVEPPYLGYVAAQNNIADNHLQLGIIALYLGSEGSIDSNWTLLSKSGSFIKSVSVVNEGTTGGSVTHTHAAQGHTHNLTFHQHTVPQVSHTADVRDSSGTTDYATDTTIHASSTSGSALATLSSGNTTADAANNLPTFKNVLLVRLDNVYANDERESEITGSNPYSDRDSEIHGALEVNGERESEIIVRSELDISRTFRILVKDENDKLIGEFDKFDKLKFGKTLNNYGSAVFSIPVNDDKASDLISLRKYSIWIYRQESASSVLVWSGEQAMRECSLDSDGNGWVTIHCYTWLEQLKDRYTASEVIFTSQDAGSIAWDLIDTSQSVTNGDFGITEGSIASTVDRDRSYYNQNILEAIVNLANIISGFDFYITDNRVFNVYSIMGSDKTDSIILEYGHNISSIRITEDFVNPINRGIVLGTASDETTLQRIEYDDATLQAENKIREGVLNEMDVSESATLEDKGEALVRKYGTSLLKVEPVLTKSSDINITTFGLGDVIRLKVNYGIYNIDEDYRIFEWEVTYNNDNSEELSLVLGNFTL